MLRPPTPKPPHRATQPSGGSALQIHRVKKGPLQDHAVAEQWTEPGGRVIVELTSFAPCPEGPTAPLRRAVAATLLGLAPGRRLVLLWPTDTPWELVVRAYRHGLRWREA